MKTKKAFSIVELIIVVAVIGILAAVLIPVISNAVKNANAKSALSDARNALTNYESYVQSNEINSGDVIFIVHKAKGLYVYGLLAGKGSLYESVDNYYELANKNADEVNVADEAQKLLAKLIENGSIAPSPLQNQENITEKVKDVPDTVAVFYGYKLQSFIADISFEKAVVDLAIGDTEQLKAFVNPETEIEFSSSNPEIVSVDENGTVTAKALGTATITAKSGNKIAECTANVMDYLEFYGTMEQLKQYFEETGETTIFLRLMVDVSSYNATLFPLTVPENKYMRIDLNGKNIYAYQYSNDENPTPNCVMKNCGGKLMVENNDLVHAAGINGYFDGENPASDDGYIAAIKNEKGTLIIKNPIDEIRVFANYMANVTVAIENYDIVIIMDVNNYILGLDDYNQNPMPVFLRNASGATAVLSDINNYGSIINEGVIELTNCKFRNRGNGMLNKGTIIKMENWEFETLFEGFYEDNYFSVAFNNQGTVGDITNCKFISTDDDYNDYFDYYTTAFENYGTVGDIIDSQFLATENGTVCKLKGGKINSIQNCEFIGTENALIVSEGFILTNKLTDGKYSHTVPTSLIASGYSCKAQDDYFVISK